MPRRPGWFSCLLLLGAAWPCLARETVPPHLYGRVVLDNRSSAAGIPPAVFDHWRHRALFTCRLCHVDIGFAMAAGATQVTASTNRSGFHCGACHDGKTRFKRKTIFASCSESPKLDSRGDCRRCHDSRDPDGLRGEYQAFAEGMPQRRQGGVDWEAAMAEWRIRPLDFVEGQAIRRTPLTMQKDVSIESTGWMKDVIFSHRKHATWNGCEVCHPGIYPSTKHGTVKYSMLQISSGDSCGVCHGRVAFPLNECEGCHVHPVR